MNNFLRTIARDLCESCTAPVSVFKQSFERAGHGETLNTQAVNIATSAPHMQP